MSQLSQLEKPAVVTDVDLETIVIKRFSGSVTTVTTVTAVFTYIGEKNFFLNFKNNLYNMDAFFYIYVIKWF